MHPESGNRRESLGGYLSNLYDVTSLTTFVGYQAAVVLDPFAPEGDHVVQAPAGLPGNAADNDYVVTYICFLRNKIKKKTHMQAKKAVLTGRI